MKLLDMTLAYFDLFQGKYKYLVELHHSDVASKQEIINANNQFLTDLINSHAKSDLVSQYVSVNSHWFDENIGYLFEDIDLVKEIVKLGSNFADYFGYCGFVSDSTKLSDGFCFVIDSHCLAFSPNNMQSFTDLILRNIRFRKAIYVPTDFDPAYQLPTWSIFGVNFKIVPEQKVKYPYIEF